MKEEFEIELWKVRARRQKQLNDANDALGIAEGAAQSTTLSIHSEVASLRRGSYLNAGSINSPRVLMAPTLPPSKGNQPLEWTPHLILIPTLVLTPRLHYYSCLSITVII